MLIIGILVACIVAFLFGVLVAAIHTETRGDWRETMNCLAYVFTLGKKV